MLDSIRKFFRDHVSRDTGLDEAATAERARVAAAALLVEVVKSDNEFTLADRKAVLEAAQRSFDLDGEAARKLVQLAELEADAAPGLYPFTSLINSVFTPEQKVQLVEELWRVAWSDDSLHRYEEHVIRKVAELIYVPHSAFIAAKLRVQDARGA